MSKDDVTRIRINKQSIGIIGLKDFMEEMAGEYAEKSDDKLQAELIKRLSRKNYIPERAKDDYGKALLREFKKFLGKPYEEEISEGLEIKVLGPGCPQCNRLEKELMEVMAEMNLGADVEHITDIKEIGRYGVMGTPALVVNGKIKSVGSVPPRGKIIGWLKEAQNSIR
jgi:small redox-active disulfide protein 2